jgi:glycosyltransferase involved in cell wall biosynthesis
MPDPRVSVVVPAYNYARFVAQALDSLLRQTYESLEVIVIDDASTDPTPDVLAPYQQDPRVCVIRHADNRGHVRTYNEGLALARGDFVGLLSADDLCLRPDAIARQVAIFDADPAVGFVYSALTFVDEAGRLLNTYGRWPEDGIRDGMDEFGLLVFSNHVPASGPLVRAACHRQVGYYDERLPHAADWDLWLRLATRYRVGYIADSLYGYRRQEINMHRRVVTPNAADADHRLVLRKAFETLPPSAPPAIRRLHRPAMRRLAHRAIDLEREWGRCAAGWRRFGHVLRHYPELLIDPTFYATMAKLTVLTLLGRRGAARVAAIRRRLQAASAGS